MCVCVWMDVYMHVCMNAYMYVYSLCMHVCMYITNHAVLCSITVGDHPNIWWPAIHQRYDDPFRPKSVPPELPCLGRWNLFIYVNDSLIFQETEIIRKQYLHYSARHYIWGYIVLIFKETREWWMTLISFFFFSFLF